MLESLFNKVVGPRPATLLKKGVFPSEIWDTFKNTYFNGTFPVITSVSKFCKYFIYTYSTVIDIYHYLFKAASNQGSFISEYI